MGRCQGNGLDLFMDIIAYQVRLLFFLLMNLHTIFTNILLQRSSCLKRNALELHGAFGPKTDIPETVTKYSATFFAFREAPWSSG